MKTLKIALWTVGLSLICVLFYIAHENRERAIRGRYIESHLQLGMSVSEVEKVLGFKIVLQPASGGPKNGYEYRLDKSPGGIYHAGYDLLFWFDREKKLGYHQYELTPVWGETEIGTSNPK